ncbi:MAG: zinc-ribbon and DUF3426 domain-containing protein [Rubrivivax sp.]
MSTNLATRCPTCSTVFRVVPDQLRVSDGWVRCGRCAEVFNAAQALLDATTGAPRTLPGEFVSSTPQGGYETDEAAHAGDEQAPGVESPFETTQVLFGDEVTGEADNAGHGYQAAASTGLSESPPAAQPGMADRVGTDDGDVDTEAEELAPATAAGIDFEDHGAFGRIDPRDPSDPIDPPALNGDGDNRAADAGPGDASNADDTDSLEPWAPASLPEQMEPIEIIEPIEPLVAAPPFADFRATPSFVRRADRAEQWRRPGVRLALAAVVMLSLLALAAQVTYVYRDLVAARFPVTRPALQQMCTVFGCSIGPARMIDALTVEASGLLRVAQTDGYRLSLTLRNRSGIALALPAVDLSLTDSQGKLLARRVLRPAELGATQAELGAGRELQLRATLQTATDPVAGYTIELFYP